MMRVRVASLLFVVFSTSSAFLLPSSPSPLVARSRSGVKLYESHSNQMMEDGETVTSLVEAYNKKKADKRAAEDKEEERLSKAGAGGGEGGVLASLRAFTQSKNFLFVEGAVLLSLFALVDGAWSGDWTEYGYISAATEQYMKSCSLQIGFAHLCLAGLSSVILEAKGKKEDSIDVLRTLAVGGVDFMRVALMADKEEDEATALNNAPPLSMQISTMQIRDTKATDGVLLSTSLHTLPGKHQQMSKLLTDLVHASTTPSDKDTHTHKHISTFAVNQDPEDRRNFLLLQRFPSLTHMQQYQKTTAFTQFTDKAFPLLAEPFGLYIVNERKGKLTEPNYPFGPGGEGGRDDAIYSSPTNLDGSQGGAFAQAGEKKVETRV